MNRRSFLKSAVGLGLAPVLAKAMASAVLVQDLSVKVDGILDESLVERMLPITFEKTLLSPESMVDLGCGSLWMLDNPDIQMNQAAKFADGIRGVLAVLEPAIDALEQLKDHEIVIGQEEIDEWLRDLRMVAGPV